MLTKSSASRGSTAVLTAFIVLTFYSLGAGYLESFVNYPLWHIIGPTDRWVAYHEALGPRVVVVLAIPAIALSLIANALLLRFRPPVVPTWTVAATLALLVVGSVSTFAIQIPIQVRLDAGYDRATVDHLISSSLWLRELTGGLRAAIAGYMLHLALAAPAHAADAVRRGAAGGVEARR